MYNNETLPDLLSEVEFLTYYGELKQKNKKAREKIITGHMRLVISLASQMPYDGCCELDDLVSVGMEGLIKAVDSYNISNGPFREYASKWIYDEMMTYINEINKTNCESNELGSLAVDFVGNCLDQAETIYLQAKIKDAMELLPEKQMKAIEFYFGLTGSTYRHQEIARLLCMSVNNVSSEIKSGIESIKDMIKEDDTLIETTKHLRKSNHITKEEYNNFINVMQSPEFMNLLDFLTPFQATIVCLLKSVNVQHATVNNIAECLGIKEDMAEQTMLQTLKIYAEHMSEVSLNIEGRQK